MAFDSFDRIQNPFRLFFVKQFLRIESIQRLLDCPAQEKIIIFQNIRESEANYDRHECNKLMITMIQIRENP
jgi:hypothetical protein